MLTAYTDTERYSFDSWPTFYAFVIGKREPIRLVIDDTAWPDEAAGIRRRFMTGTPAVAEAKSALGILAAYVASHES